jgi:signal transduction histidine kinase
MEESVRNLAIANGAEPSPPVSRLSRDWFSGDLLETLPAAVYVCNAEAVVVAYNRRAAELWGRAPSAGDTDEKYCGAHKLFRSDGSALPHNQTPMEWVLRTGKPARDMEVVIERPDTSRVSVLVNIAPLFCENGQLIGAVNCFQDLSAHEGAERERIRLAEELHQAKKMEAIGQLTAGIVHDVNNLLAVILGNIEILENRTDDHASLKLLRNAARSVERGERLTQQLLAFARKQKLLPKPVDLNQLLVGMSNLLQTSIEAAIRIERRMQPGLGLALVDPNQIELVLLNLALNARDAMPGGGTLTIETGNATLRGADRPDDLPAGEYALISVSDTGTGMTDEVRAKAFEPFFTTKEIGKGAGLGLSMVLGVARQSGGGVRIISQAGEGTSIEVYLPRAAAAPSADRPLPGALRTAARRE